MDWGYTNARIRGMKSRLLDHHALDSLILQPDLDSLLGELEKTPYREDIVAARGKYTGLACVEHALQENFTRTFRKILGFVRRRRQSSTSRSSSTAGMSRTSRRSFAARTSM